MIPHLLPLISRIFRRAALGVLAVRGAIALTAGEVAAPSTAPLPSSAWTLRPLASAGTAGVMLSDLVDFGTSTNFAALSSLRITNAPTVGRATAISRAFIESILRQRVAAPPQPRWEGAAECSVSRRTRPLEETEVLERLTTAMQKSYVGDRGELELIPTRPWVPPVIADEPGTLRIVEFPASGISASFIVRFELKAGREILGSWQIPLQARVWRDLYIATTSIPRGTTLADAPWARERRDALSIRDAVGALPADASGLELGESLLPGSVLTTRMIRQRPVISRGRLVEVLVQDGGLTISVRALALEDGLPGQVIRVRNPHSQKEFNGKVQNADTVLVTL